MFGKEPETMADESKVNSILGKGCKYKGTFDGEGTFRVDGEFEGTVKSCETIHVGKTGVVKAEITVKNAIIWGKVVGNIMAENRIELQAGSHLQGNIKTSRLVIDEGVFFEGNCSMSPDSKIAGPPHHEQEKSFAAKPGEKSKVTTG
jgi:cytoskeletal protein CcmA (bactofilin family)